MAFPIRWQAYTLIPSNAYGIAFDPPEDTAKMEEGAPGLIIHFSVKAVIDLSDATAKDVLRVLLSGKDALPNFRIVDAIHLLPSLKDCRLKRLLPPSAMNR